MLIITVFFASITSTVKADSLDKTKPTIKLNIVKDKATYRLNIKVNASNSLYEVKYAKGLHRQTFFSSSYYKKQVKNISLKKVNSIEYSIPIKNGELYTIYVTDIYSNVTIKRIKIKITDSKKTTVNNNDGEVRAAWITFLDYSNNGYESETEFNLSIAQMFDNIVKSGLNTVYVHVRPFSDAMYNSNYFPWSKYASGRQGDNPSFDPLKNMIRLAKERKLSIHAYINPYRVTTKNEYKNLAINNPAYIWLNDGNDNNDRNVLRFGDVYYYNPSSEEVISLIVNGVSEIIENYSVDGIIFDDYFYPNLGSKYKTNFDYVEYNIYKENNPEAKSIVDWRKDNVNKLLKRVYNTIKSKDKNLTFGISPAGNITNLKAEDKNYVDIDRWLSEDGFIDYIVPQQYWGFEHEVCPFEENVNKWINLIKNPKIKLYIALPMHKTFDKDIDEWKNNNDVIARMISSLRSKGLGFSIYRYNFMKSETEEYKNMVNEIMK